MEFRILGPLEVLRDGEPLDVGPHKQRSLLALLLLHANRVVTTDHILEELWGEEAEGKENALWVYVSRLRAILEPNRSKDAHPQVLVTKDHGYLLHVEPDSIDAYRFEKEVDRARSLIKDDAVAASGILRDALAEWRGSALQEFAYDNFAQTEITRLTELRLGAIEDAVEADLRAGKSGELIGELEPLHQQHPLRERPVGQLMLALYRAGRSADALRTFERFRRSVGEELGIDPSPELCRLEEQILLHDSRLQLRRPKPVRVATPGLVVNPFRGLRPFSEDDAGDFFGRDRLIAEVVRRLSEGDRLIALVGPSGSGKSSAVLAGLIPAIRKGAVSGSDQWLVAHMLPGSDPFIELEAALLRSTIDAPDSLAEPLRAEDGSGLLRAALRVLPTESSRLLLVIDQFEELFTLAEDQDVRNRFLDQLVGAVDEAYGRVTVVVPLRADFYGRPLEHAEFGTRMGAGIVNVVPLTSDELEDAALQPARRTGVTLEPALLAELITDVIGQPGALPMFQYTLTELFDRRVDDVLTIDTYRSMGGVRGSLTRKADELFEQLDDSEREVAQQLFLRLVTIAENDEWTRRRVHASELVALDVDVVTMQKVIEVFTRHRLLSLDRDQVSGAPTVEVAHEALLREWERLKGWIEQNREDLLRHRDLAMAANRWNASGHDHDYLYGGGRLDEAQRWSRDSVITLTDREREFLDAGLARRQDEEDRERDRLVAQERLERTARWRTRGMVAAVAILVAVIGGVLWATRPQGPKVALVYEGTDSGSAQNLILDGWEQAQRELPFREATVVSLIDPQEDMRDLAEAGYGLIISGIFDRGFAASQVAKDYPDTRFVILNGSASSENVTSFAFVREGGAYLMGAAAALQSETGRIGFIGGAQWDTTEARRAAYTAGARSINQDVEVDAVYLGPYHDPTRGGYVDVDLARITAENMYRSGVDVIHHSAGEASKSLPDAADELTEELGHHLWVIGSEIDEQRQAPAAYRDHFLTSMWKRSDRAVYEAVRSYLADELPPGRLELGLETGAVDYSTEGGLSPIQISRLEEIKTDILAGRLEPPSASGEPPRWTRNPTVTTTLVFDGHSCSSNQDSLNLVTGDVVHVNILNESDDWLGFALGKLSAGVAVTDIWNTADDNPWTKDLVDFEGGVLNALTEPGATNAVSVRLTTGSFVADCFPSSGTPSPGLVLTARFETTCEGPPIESDDPADVVRAMAEAINSHDAAVVCSLFSEDARPSGAEMADAMVPKDDDHFTPEGVVTEIEVSDGVVTLSYDQAAQIGLFNCRIQAGVESGKIIWVGPPECKPAD